MSVKTNPGKRVPFETNCPWLFQDRLAKYFNAIIQIQFRINHIWSALCLTFTQPPFFFLPPPPSSTDLNPFIQKCREEGGRGGLIRSHSCLIQTFLSLTRRRCVHGAGGATRSLGGGAGCFGCEGVEWWTTCFYHRGHIFHD